MKKIITCLGLMTFAWASSAQEVEIYVQGETEDVSGTVVEIASGDENMNVIFEIKNVDDADLNARVERIRITELDGTKDYLCWGLECYDEDLVSGMDVFVSPDNLLIEPDSMTLLFSYHSTYENAGCAQYRYFILNELDARVDSVDVLFCSTVSIEEDEQFNVSVFPNPANEIVTIELDLNTNNVGFELYNVLGNVVMTKNLVKGQNHLNVEALPNGVYFYAIMHEGNAVETKKLVVRH